MRNREPDIFEQIGAFLTKNPIYFGWLVIAVGILFLVEAVIDAEWLFGHAKTFNLDKIEGWVSFFGRNTARLIVGINGLILIIIGIVCVILSW
ncbi:MAG: immunity 17 family protein [Bacteroidales bacterium]|jgi:multisubunit Na+/H+ antiporter MnhG subunit|nr:immunity 17 family protein [Bacteroidales bacterium]